MNIELTLKDETQRNKVYKFLQGHLPWGNFIFKSKKKIVFDLSNHSSSEKEVLLVVLRMLALQKESCRKDYRDLAAWQHLDVKTFPNRKVPNLVINGQIHLVLPQEQWSDAVNVNPELAPFVVTPQGLKSTASSVVMEVVENLQEQYFKHFGSVYVL